MPTKNYVPTPRLTGGLDRATVAARKLAAIEKQTAQAIAARYGLNGDDDLRFPIERRGRVKSYTMQELLGLEAASLLPGIECVGPQCPGLHVGELQVGDHFFCVCGTSYLRCRDSTDDDEIVLDIWHDRQRQIVQKVFKKKRFCFPGPTST